MASRCRPVSQPKRNVAPATDTKSAVARKVSTTSGALSGTKAIGSSFSGQYRRGRESPEAALAPVEVSQRRLELGHGEIRPERGGEVELGVSALPQQKVAQAPLAAGADKEVHGGGPAGVGEQPREAGARRGPPRGEPGGGREKRFFGGGVNGHGEGGGA